MACVFQVLQDEHVEAESLDQVDASAKALLDRLGVPVIFPDGLVDTHHSPHATQRNATQKRHASTLTGPLM